MWDNPTTGVTSADIPAGVASVTRTLAVPVANTNARTTSAAFDKCYLSGGSCATTGAFDSL